MKKRIHFNSGATLIVTQSIANTLSKNILNGCNQFQIFSNEKNREELEIMINLQEISFIEEVTEEV